MKCGVRFCGGCNSRFDRGAAYRQIREALAGKIEFDYAEEDVPYDLLLVIGGCPNCCASYEQFQTSRGVIKMWDIAELEEIIKIMEDFYIGLEKDL